MQQAQRQTRSYLMELFEQQGLSPRGDLGQNFLIDLNLVELIADEAGLDERDVVLEIGAGTAGLTTHLAERAGDVISVEYDRRMHLLASQVVEGAANVTLIRGDALKNKNRFAPRVLEAVRERLADGDDRRLKLVANLPYNIATPIISNLAATDLPWDCMVVTIQLELAQRMLARPRTPQYGSLTVWLQSQCSIELLRRLPPNVFWPRPQVTSAIMRLTCDPERRAEIDDRAFFHEYIRRVFLHRRKLLRSTLCGMYRKRLDKPAVDALLAEMGFSPTTRAEELSVRDHVRLANALRHQMNKLRGRMSRQQDEAVPASGGD